MQRLSGRRGLDAQDVDAASEAVPAVVGHERISEDDALAAAGALAADRKIIAHEHAIAHLWERTASIVTPRHGGSMGASWDDVALAGVRVRQPAIHRIHIRRVVGAGRRTALRRGLSSALGRQGGDSTNPSPETRTRWVAGVALRQGEEQARWGKRQKASGRPDHTPRALRPGAHGDVARGYAN